MFYAVNFFFSSATFIDISYYVRIHMAKWWIGTSGKNLPNPFLGISEVCDQNGDRVFNLEL